MKTKLTSRIFIALTLALATALLIGAPPSVSARVQCEGGSHPINGGKSCSKTKKPATAGHPAKSAKAAHCKSSQKAVKKGSGKNKGKYYCRAKKSSSHGSSKGGSSSGLSVNSTDYSTQLPDVSASNSTFQNILQILFAVIGALAILFVAIGGLRYIIAGDNPQDSAKARGTIIYAIAGGILAISAELIVTFVLDKL